MIFGTNAQFRGSSREKGKKRHVDTASLRELSPTMGDIKDILGIKGAAGPPAPRAPKPSMKKPEGMSREVFALLHHDSVAKGSAVPIVPTVAPNAGVKEKTSSRLVGWDWKQFANAARDDNLRLSHWVKNNDKSTVYT